MTERVMVSSFAKNKYGVARDTRTLIEKVRDEGWRPIGVEPDRSHGHNLRIAELEAKAKQAALDDELREAGDDFEKRELIVLKQRRRADFAAQDLAADKAAHLATVKGEVEFLVGLRAKLAADSERTVSDIILVDRALEQYAVQGVDKSHGDKLLAAVKQNEAKLVADKRKTLTDQAIALSQELARLDAAIKNPNAEPEPAAKITVPHGATVAERAEIVKQHLKSTGRTAELIDFFESEDSPEERAKIVDEFSEVAEAESTVVVEGDSAE